MVLGTAYILVAQVRYQNVGGTFGLIERAVKIERVGGGVLEKPEGATVFVARDIVIASWNFQVPEGEIIFPFEHKLPLRPRALFPPAVFKSFDGPTGIEVKSSNFVRRQRARLF